MLVRPQGCLETLPSGPGMAKLLRRPGADVLLRAEEILARAERAKHRRGRRSSPTFRTASRVPCAHVINLLDPDVIVLGGGLSKMDHLYTALPPLVRRRVFSDFVDTPIVSNRHGDSSGVRGAAWLWSAEA